MPPKSPKPATTEPNTPWIPTEAQIAAAENKTLDDVIGFNLDILFCGINPSLYSAAIGKHYGRPQNRFWRALHESGLTDRLVSPFDERSLLNYNLGLTDLVSHATRAESSLTLTQKRADARDLHSKITLYKPRVVAFVGLGIFRSAFSRPKAVIGRQEESLGGAIIWILPSTSGLNAGYTIERITALFRELKEFSNTGNWTVGPELLVPQTEVKTEEVVGASESEVKVKPSMPKTPAKRKPIPFRAVKRIERIEEPKAKDAKDAERSVFDAEEGTGIRRSKRVRTL